jgi:hypothetical protein
MADFTLANSASSWCSFASLRLSNYSNSETARFRNSHPFSNTLPIGKVLENGCEFLKRAVSELL